MKRETVTLSRNIGIAALIALFAVVNLSGRHSAVVQANATELVTAKSTNASTSKGHWPKMVTIASGTVLVVSLKSTLRSDREMSGDGFVARLYEAVRLDGLTVLPAGTEVLGHLLLVAEPYTSTSKAQISLLFDRIVDPSGRIFPISTSPIVFVGQGNNSSSSGKEKMTALTLVKAGAGASAGAIIVLATKSQQIELPSNQRFAVRLDEPLRVSVAELTANR